MIDRDLAPDDEGGEQGRRAQVAALVLAAGCSARMGGPNKLLQPVAGIAMVARVVDAALASRCRDVTVVVGHDAQRVREALAHRPVRFASNPEYAEGIASSLRAGLRSLPARCDAALVLLADMPGIRAEHIDRLIGAFEWEPAIVVPVRAGRRGNPVLWPRDLFGEMMALHGDTGARGLIEAHRDRVRAVQMDTDAIFIDVDTIEALDALAPDEH
jgi:molybdenum cofactor cytidylyltransferase